MSGPFASMINTLFRHGAMAEDCTYRPLAAAEQSIRVLRYQGEVQSFIGDAGAVQQATIFSAKVSDIAEPKEGELLIIASEIFKIRHVERDANGLLWRFDVDKVR